MLQIIACHVRIEVVTKTVVTFEHAYLFNAQNYGFLGARFSGSTVVHSRE